MLNRRLLAPEAEADARRIRFAPVTGLVEGPYGAAPVVGVGIADEEAYDGDVAAYSCGGLSSSSRSCALNPAAAAAAEPGIRIRLPGVPESATGSAKPCTVRVFLDVLLRDRLLLPVRQLYAAVDISASMGSLEASNSSSSASSTVVLRAGAGRSSASECKAPISEPNSMQM